MVRLFRVLGIIRALEGVEVIKPLVIQNGQNGFLLVKGECVYLQQIRLIITPQANFAKE